MTQENSQIPCKPRFKGVEHFLKRVAFNLGNSPSQTEVKIISCIPIDVTDLQQKIVILEKELNDARAKIEAKNKNKKEAPPPATVGRALCDSSIINRPSTSSRCEINTCAYVLSQQLQTRGCDCTLKQNKSGISYIYPSISKPNVNVIYERRPSNHSFISKWDKHKLIANERVKSIFRKRKKKKVQEKTRGNTQLVYYTHTNTNNMDVLSRSYLADVFKKHHDPKLVVNEFSDTSHFSQPICRDLRQDYKHSSPYDLDICSCCHGEFHNLDIYMNDFHVNNTKTIYNIDEKKNNFVTDLGDLIPVKEKLDKVRINEYTKRKLKNNKDAEFWPENIYTNFKHHNPVVNYQIGDLPVIKPKHKNRQRNNEINHSGKIKPKHKSILNSNPRARVETEKMCYVACGDAYIKSPTAPIKLKLPSADDEVKKTNLREKEQNFKPNSITADCTKTELTLNEIKRILQTVLTEIKNNSDTLTVKRQEKNKKDAVVQKGPSHNNVQPSPLLQSFTYNTSDYTNPYLYPYPGRIPTAQYCFPNIAYDPMRCMQSSQVNRLDHAAHICKCNHRDNAVQISEKDTTTNILTDKQIHETDNRETEKLIKEIYRSVAPNMEYPSKESSFSRYDELKSVVNESTVTDTIVFTDTSSDFSKVMKKDVQVEALLSAATTATTASNVVYTATNTQPRYPCKLLKTESNTESRKIQCMTNNCITETEELSDATSSTESDANVAALGARNTKGKKKDGIIKNMLNSVNIFKRKKECDKKEGTSDTSNSDEYETIYSEKANNTPRVQWKRISGINYTKPPAYRTKKRTPHMDQEYRRHWDEDLIFRENGYSPKLATKSYRNRPSQPVFRQNYEARAAVIKPAYLNNKSGHIYDSNTRPKKLSWLKRRELRTGCGKRWKDFILEN